MLVHLKKLQWLCSEALQKLLARRNCSTGEIIVFRHLSEDDFVKIAKLMLSEYIDSLAEKGIEFTFDENAQKALAKKAYGGKSGARDLRNVIRKEVEDKIASAIIDNRSVPIGRIHLGADGDELKLDVL